MVRLEMKSYNIILKEKEQKYQVKLINMNILELKKYYPQIKKEWWKAKFTCSSLGKALEKQTKTTEGKKIKNKTNKKKKSKSEDRIPISFNSFHHPLGYIRKIKDRSIDPEKAKEKQ